MPREILGAQYLLADVERELPTVANKPALLVWDHKDQAFKDRHRMRWEQTFPNHRTVILRNASHCIQEDAADEIVAAIVDWWPMTRGTAVPGNQS